MKKKIICLILVLIAMLIPSGVIMADEAHDIRLVDEAGLLSAEEYEKILGKLDSVSERQKFEVVIVTVNSIGNSTIRDFADDYYDYHNYGYNSGKDGILLLVNMEDETRGCHISTVGYGITAFTDAGQSYIYDRFMPDLIDGYYFAAFDTFIDECDRFVTHARESEPYDVDSMPKDYNAPLIIGGSVLAGLVISIIVIVCLVGQLKSVRAKKTASEYIVSGSMKVVDSRDIYLYSHVTKHAKPKQTSSSSSSGGGSSTHRSSSGTTHGGSSRKF